MPNINRVSLVGGLVFAIFDAICAFFAAFGLLNPIIAAAAMAFSSLSVVLNSVSLKRLNLRKV